MCIDLNVCKLYIDNQVVEGYIKKDDNEQKEIVTVDGSLLVGIIKKDILTITDKLVVSYISDSNITISTKLIHSIEIGQTIKIEIED